MATIGSMILFAIILTLVQMIGLVLLYFIVFTTPIYEWIMNKTFKVTYDTFEKYEEIE